MDWSRGQACQRIDPSAEDGKACVNRQICRQLSDKGSGWRELSRIWSLKGQRLHFGNHAIIIICPLYSKGTGSKSGIRQREVICQRPPEGGGKAS